eukprot:CAMPEP_0178988944 /NCGR_PEP_ID=MMETSP0795-20121207/4080_1 /TAXON_ID=88552 /ORGANISM="Amoebophrya sp., Strain Ameob2" /LENGTH=118 /DNA_ID=CAMNT_0020680251 /DNA_START=140 /DNA_END=496 /DNA_ORIENTATION=+
MFEEKGAVTNLAGVRRPEGLTLLGPHNAPVEVVSSTAVDLTPDEVAKLHEKQAREKEAIHQQRLLKNTRRNPTGGWYEGLPTNHKIACVYNERKDPLMIKEQEGEADFESERRAGGKQ